MRIGPIEFVTPPLVEGPKIMFKIGELPVTTTVTSTWFIIIVLFVILYINSRNLKVVPGKLQTAIEAIYEFLDGLVGQMLGTWKPIFITFIGTLFTFILFSNILSFFPIPWYSMDNGVVAIAPAFRSPTADLNTTVGLALLTFIAFTATKFYIDGVGGYFKSYLTPMPFMLPLNILSLMAKPTNISVRLFGNMFAGSVILGLLYMAAPWVVPAPLHLYFDLFGGVVQSFVFTMLTLVYIQESLGDAEYTPKSL